MARFRVYKAYSDLYEAAAVFLMACMCIATLLTAVAYAQEVNAVLEDTLTDSLTSQEDVRWYSFVMNERGDMELIIRGLQERWDGWNNHWSVVVYAQDLQTVLAQEAARGYNADYSPPAQISLLELEAGTYYIRISAAHYTTDSYQLELSRTYSSVQPFVNSSDNNIYSMGDDAFLDRLTSEDQVRWYSFTMAEPGDAELVVAGQQEHWDGYVYHWVCTMYESDRETVIEQASVRGYSENTDPSVLSATGLAADTYYVQMKSSSSTNPLMTTFTAEPYKMQLLRSYTSAGTVSGDAGSTSSISDTVNDATGTVTATSLNVRGGPGTSYDVLGTLANGTVVTITGNSDGWYRIQYNGTDGWISGQYVEIQTTNEEQVNIDAGTDGQQEKLENSDQLETSEDSSILDWIIKHKVATGIIIFSIFIIICLLGGSSSTSSSSSYSSSSYSSSSWSSSYDYKPSQSHDSGYDDVIAAAAAQEMSRVTATYGEDWKGYDPEAPQPWDKPYDPEAPQPWDTNWLDAE